MTAVNDCWCVPKNIQYSPVAKFNSGKTFLRTGKMLLNYIFNRKRFTFRWPGSSDLKFFQ